MDREEWLRERMKGIGGSEMAAILGLSPWQGPHDVWARKTGRMPEQDDNFRFKVGRLFEAPIAQLYADREKVSLAKIDGLIRHPTAPIVGTPDRLIVMGKKRGVEIKTSSPAFRHQWGEEYTDDVPAYYLVQCATYMFLTGMEEWDLVPLFGFNERDLMIFRIRRDEELEAMLIDAATVFWNDYVLADKEPPITGSEGCTRYLERRYPKNTLDLRDANEEETKTIGDLVKARSDTAYAEAIELSLENRVKALIGECDGIWSVNGRFTWKKGKDQPVVNWEAAARDLYTWAEGVIRIDLDAYLKTFTKTKEGSRVFRYTPAR